MLSSRPPLTHTQLTGREAAKCTGCIRVSFSTADARSGWTACTAASVAWRGAPDLWGCRYGRGRRGRWRLCHQEVKPPQRLPGQGSGFVQRRNLLEPSDLCCPVLWACSECWADSLLTTKSKEEMTLQGYANFLTSWVMSNEMYDRIS